MSKMLSSTFPAAEIMLDDVTVLLLELVTEDSFMGATMLAIMSTGLIEAFA